eukprot:1157168-Pelagomonas_calceolata.AAC.5
MALSQMHHKLYWDKASNKLHLKHAGTHLLARFQEFSGLVSLAPHRKAGQAPPLGPESSVN